MELQPASSYRIRINDCDPFAHLNNGRYLDYFLNAREDQLRTFYGLELHQFYKQGTGWVVGSHEIKYIRPVTYPEIVWIQSALVEAGDGNLWVEMIMTDEARTQLKSVLWTEFIHVSLRTGKKVAHPAEFMHFVGSIEFVGAGNWKDRDARTAEIITALASKAPTTTDGSAPIN